MHNSKKRSSLTRDMTYYTFDDASSKLAWIHQYCIDNSFTSCYKRIKELFELMEIATQRTKEIHSFSNIDPMSLFIPIHEILILYDIFKFIDEHKNSVPRKLILSLLRADGDPRVSLDNTNGRDHQFELQLAMTLSKYGNTITGFDDVECLTVSGLQFAIQCKRPKAESTIWKNIRKAGHQLILNSQISSHSRGVIAVCLDSVKNASNSFNNTPALHAIHELKRDQSVEMQIVFEKLFAIPRFSRISGGIAILNHLIWDGDTNTLKPQMDIHKIYNYHNSNSIEDMAQLMPGFGGGFSFTHPIPYPKHPVQGIP